MASELPIEVSFGELTRDGHKVLTGFIRDISEGRQPADKLGASERSLRELTETIHRLSGASAIKDVLQPGLSSDTRNEGSSWSREGLGKYSSALMSAIVNTFPTVFAVSSLAPASPSSSTRIQLDGLIAWTAGLFVVGL
jgi:hypothetical protein